MGKVHALTLKAGAKVCANCHITLKIKKGEIGVIENGGTGTAFRVFWPRLQCSEIVAAEDIGLTE